jgi:hypothetical protein
VDLQDSNAPSPIPPGANAGVHQALNTLYPYNDEGRATAFARDMTAFGSAGAMPQLNVMILFDDHTAGYLPGASSPEDYVAENDHALGEVVQSISHSKFWNDSAIFVTEDDTQGGVDHVDAHRSFGLVISPWAKRGGLSHQHMSFSSMNKTIDLLLGLPPTSTEELTASSMASDFVSASGLPDFTPYTALPNTTFPVTNPTAAQATNPAQQQAAALALTIPQGIDQGGELAPEDEALGRIGALVAGDPNVVAQPNVSQQTLPNVDPTPAPAPSGQSGPWWGTG